MLMVATVIELVYIIALSIFRDKIYLSFKIIELVLFVLVEVLFLAIFGFSDSLGQEDFLDLGYAVDAVFLIMIVVGFLRVGYLLFKKIKDFWKSRYDYGDAGELTKH